MRWGAVVLAAAALHAQTAQFRPLHASAQGSILDDAGKPVLLRGVNRSGIGSGNGEGGATDAEYAAQSQLLASNLVASWSMPRGGRATCRCRSPIRSIRTTSTG